MGKFTRLHRGKGKTSASSFKIFEDIPSKPEALDKSRQAKIFLIISSVALHSYESITAFLYIHVILLRRLIVKFVKCNWQLSHEFSS